MSAEATPRAPRRAVRAHGRRARTVRPPSRSSRILKVVLSCAALLGAFSFTGLQVWRDVALGVGSWVSGDVRASGSGADRRMAWREPEPLPAEFASGGLATRVAFAPDGRRAVVAHGERGSDASLWLLELEGDRVVDERPLTEIDEPGDELAPWFDGETLWFASDRAGGRGGLDLWSARFVDGSFERPERLAGDVNSTADDTDPTVCGAELVFASDRGGEFDLWSGGIASGPVSRIDALSAAGDERDPAFAPDGGSLWFAARSGTSFDLVRAFRAGARWLERERVDELSTDADERGPAPRAGGFDVAFLRGGDAATAWRARSVELRRVPPRAWKLAEILLLASLLALSALAWFARDVSRYDTLIAAWAASILVHALALFALGEMRAPDPARGGADGDGEPFQLRVVPSERPSGLTGGGRGNGGALERADTSREIAGIALASGADLSAEISAPREAEPVPGRGAARAEFAAAARSIEEAPVGGIPSATVADARPDPTQPGRSTRGVAADGPRPGFERFEARAPAPGASPADAAVGSPLALERGVTEAPLVVRATPEPSASSAGARAVEDRDVGERGIASAPPAAASSGRDVDALAALGPPASARVAAAPVLERYDAASGSRGPDPAHGSELVAPSGPSLVADIPRAREPEPASAPRIAATPYQARTGPAKQRALEEHGGTRETEAAVAKGLAYLARIQGRLGQWGPLEVRDEKYGEICVGKTALATLAFLAAGHTHLSGTEHSRVVQRALAFLLALQDPDSGHYGDTSAYSHGIATFALAEALAITGDESLRESVERAVAHLLERQSRDPDPRKFGGWPYYYPDAGRTFDPWPRTSITAWQVLALESARLSGVAVPDAAFDDAARFLEAARDERGDWYRYSHEPARLRSAYPTLPASTPAALFALSCVGRDISGPEHERARQYLLERAPRGYRFTNERDFVERGQGNPYFWYQGTLALLRAGGNAWRRWNVALQETLLPAQESDGSWRPIDVYARYARDDESDRAYTTALCVLCLEVYYRYDLPLLSAGRGADRALRGAVTPLPAASPR